LDFFFTFEASYVLFRFRQTHDIWHLVTGFDTDVIGELGLKSFELAQTRRPLAFVLLIGGLCKGLIHFPRSFEVIAWAVIVSPFSLKSGKKIGKNP